MTNKQDRAARSASAKANANHRRRRREQKAEIERLRKIGKALFEEVERLKAELARKPLAQESRNWLEVPLGKESDASIARRLGISANTVFEARRRRGIPAFRAPK